MPVIDLLTRDQRRALQMLANVPRGIAETLMIAYGLSRETVNILVLAGLATVTPDSVQIGEQTIEIKLVMITNAGRKAIED